MSIESPTNREEFIIHCKKRLSFLNVNITPDQEKILVEKSKKKFLEYHQTATEKVLIGQPITSEDLTRGYFITPDIVYEVNNVLSYRRAISLANSFFTQVDASYAFVNSSSPTANGYVFPASAQDSSTSPLINYWLAKSSFELYNSHFKRDDLFRWSRTSQKLRIIGNNKLEVGKYIVYDADITLESEERFWQTEWFIEYTVNLFKKQWGENISKFLNVELPGGMTLNGAELKSEAKERLDELEEELRQEHSNYTMLYIS